jgi:hypothetical protein
MNGLFPLVVALISVPFWCLYNYLEININRKKRDTLKTPSVEKSDIVANGSSFFQRDQARAQSEI